MLIECPSCHARAKIPDSKEGAKVRCGECGRVYVAAPPGQRGRVQRAGSQTGLMVGIGVAAVALLGFLLISRGGKKTEAGPAEEEVTEAPAPAEEEGFDWNSKAVQAVVQLHEGASLRDDARLRRLLWGGGIWARERAEAASAPEDGAEVDADAEQAPLPSSFDQAALDEFLLLPVADKEAAYERWIEELETGASKELVADWKPYDGRVIDMGDDNAIVRVDVTSREPGSATKRTVEWRLVKRDSRWQAWSWRRWISPEERKALRKPRDKGFEKVTLSDGSVVLEREPESLPHLDDTPQELRDRIDGLVATMIDLDLTKEASQAQAELEKIGRPAIPILLSQLFENELANEDQAIQANLVVQALRRITGQYFGYKPQAMIGSGTGTTEERRKSAIKQWFAWWYREGDTFTAKEEATDGLEGLIELTDKEKAWLKRNE